jgi:hypothetical protein
MLKYVPYRLSVQNTKVILTITLSIDNYNTVDTTSLLTAAVHAMVRFNFIFPILLPYPHSSLSTSMASNKLHAILRGKSVIPIMASSFTDCYLDIEVEGDFENGQERKRKLYSVQLSVADTVVAKSPRSSVLKWEWNANNQMWVLVL